MRVEEGLEGLIHISELSNQRVAHPGDVVKEGEEMKLKIISLDSERHRLGLSLKQAEDRSVAAAGPVAAVAPRFEDRPAPRRDRRDRRDRDYRPEDAISEPDEGIDSTMAAAFAESGLLAQFRTSRSSKAADAPAAEAEDVQPEATAAEPVAEVTAEPAVEAEAVAEVAEADVVAADEPATEPEPPTEPAAEPAPVAEAEPAEAVAEVVAEAEPATEPEPAPEPEAEAVPIAEVEAEAEPAPEAEAEPAPEPEAVPAEAKAPAKAGQKAKA